MKASIRTVGLASAVLLAVPFVVSAGGSVASAAPAAGTTVVNSIGAVGGTQTWDVGTDAAGGAINALSAVTDPVNLDGSLRVATPAAGDRAQVVHSLLSNPADQMSGLDLSAITALSYRAEVPATSANASVAPVLQLSMLGCVTDVSGENGFATLNYEPVYNSDTSSQPLAQGKWQSWDANGGTWWATRALGTGGTQVPKLATVSWAAIKAACGTAGRAYQVGFSLGTGTPGADGYADDLDLNGTTYDFATPHQADFTPNEPGQLTVGDAPAQFIGTVTNPADGPDYTNVRYDFSLSGIVGLKPADVSVEYLNGATWTPITLTGTGTLTGRFGLTTGFPLPHGTTNATTFRIAAKAGAPTGSLSIDDQLNNVDATTGAVLTTIAEHASQTAIVDQYVAVTPTRVIDTRVAGNPLNNGPLASGHQYTLDLSAVPGLPLNENAYTFNVTAVHPTGTGNLRIGPACGSTNPTTSIVNYQTGKDVANDLVVSNIVRGTPCNKLLVYSDAVGSSVTNVVMDLQGYFSSSSGFLGVAPARVVDTRIGVGAPQAPIAGGSHVALQIAGRGGVPSDASAVAINVTAIHPSSFGNLRIYPDGAPFPTTSNINYIRGGDQAAFAIVKLSPSGKIDVYSDNATVNVAVDVFGYLPATTNVVTQTPVRVFDSRSLGRGPLVDGVPRTMRIGGASGSGVPVNAQAVIVSLTAVHTTGSTGIGNLRAYPGGTTEPTVSNINYLGPKADVANMAIVPLGSDGTMTLATEGSTMHAVVDVIGYIPAG